VNLNKRIKTLEKRLGPERRRRDALSCQNLDFDEILKRVDAAIDQADEDIVERIIAHCHDASATPWKNQTTGEPYLDEQGAQLNEMHFFEEWLIALQHGLFSLPARLPRALLETFDRRYGCLLHRCENCMAGYGNAVVHSVCCLCGGKLLHRSLCWDSVGWETVEERAARVKNKRPDNPCPPATPAENPGPAGR
jgi:hypothetical protein